MGEADTSAFTYEDDVDNAYEVLEEVTASMATIEESGNEAESDTSDESSDESISESESENLTVEDFDFTDVELSLPKR